MAKTHRFEKDVVVESDTIEMIHDMMELMSPYKDRFVNLYHEFEWAVTSAGYFRIVMKNGRDDEHGDKEIHITFEGDGIVIIGKWGSVTDYYDRSVYDMHCDMGPNAKRERFYKIIEKMRD